MKRLLATLLVAVRALAVEPVYENDPAQVKNPDLQAPHSAESAHFRILWGRGLSQDFTEEQAKGTLRNFEDCRELFINQLGMKPPGHRDGKRYKVTIVTMNGGYNSGGGVVNIDPSGLRVDPPSWVVPHELMHAFQEAQGGHMAGHWWESHANYGAERMILNYPQHFAGQSEFDPNFPTMAHWYLAHGRDYYLCWPIWFYLDDNPDKLPGLGNNFVAKLWQQAGENDDLFNLVARLAPGVNLPDLVGRYARRAVNWDYRNGAALRAKLDEFLRDDDTRQRLVVPELLPWPGRTGWWRVPAEMAPQQGAYTIHRLQPTGPVVTVDFRGLPDRQRGADWRVSLVVRRPDGTARYGPLWNTGTGSITLAPGETNLFLVVAATPKTFLYGDQDELRYPWNSHPHRQRFPYLLKLTGATPHSASPNNPQGHRHPNGGGLVADSAKVAPSAFIGPQARVLDQAQVLDRAVVSDHAVVRGRAVVRDDARVRDWALVTDDAVVSGHARVLQRATVRERAQVKDYATVEGCADVWGDKECYLGGDAVICADYGGGRTVTNGFQFGFIPYEACPQSWINARTAPARRYVSYEFDKPHDSLAKDAPGITDGILLGAPVWRESDGVRDGFLEFDGKSQAILLEPAFGDFQEATFCVWVKRRAGRSRQTLFQFGAGAENALVVSVDAGTGRVLVQGKKHTLVASRGITAGRWTQVAVTFDGKDAVLLYDDVVVARGAFPERPEDFRGPGYFGRGATGGFFAGDADDIRVYSEALTPARMRAEVTREPGLLGVFCADRPQLFDGEQTHLATAIPNQAEGTLAAWIRPASSRERFAMDGVINADLPGQYGTGWGLAAGKIKVILDDEFWETGVAAKLNEWQHVALVFTATEARLFMDGVERAAHPYQRGGVSAQNYEVGKNAAGDEFFHGEIFNARIYSRPLTAGQIGRLAKSAPPQ